MPRLIFELWPNLRGQGWDQILITVMHNVYRHYVIVAYSEKLSDIIVLKKFEVYSTKKANIAFA